MGHEKLHALRYTLHAMAYSKSFSCCRPPHLHICISAYSHIHLSHDAEILVARVFGPCLPKPVEHPHRHPGQHRSDFSLIRIGTGLFGVLNYLIKQFKGKAAIYIKSYRF